MKLEKLSGVHLEKMRAACQLAADCLLMVGPQVKPGITTDDINTMVHNWTLERRAYPAPLGYRGASPVPFPKSVCTSVNEVVCHGIPGPRVLNDGDIVNVDVTPILDGFHGDTSLTFYVGTPSEDTKRLVETARECLAAGIAEVKDGARLGNIGAAIQELAHARGFSVVEDYVGHGVGTKFHMPPQVRHYGTRGAGEKMKAGMIFTIEPMINAGSKHTKMLEDEWTVVIVDGSLSAQFEHTVLVTKTGCEILTARRDVAANSEDRT